jgi:DNA polymerase III subunit delta
MYPKKCSILRLPVHCFLMENVHVFNGENSFDLLREKSRWIGEFSKKFGDENVSTVDASSATIRTLLDEVSVLPFLAEKRLVVINGIPKCTKEDIDLLERCVHPSALVLFVEAKPDKRSGGVKELLKRAKQHIFEPLKGAAVQTWIRSYAQEQGITLDPSALQLLVEFTGDEQAMLAREIEKLAAYKPGQTINKEDIESLCVPTEEGVVWKISDLLATGGKRDALLYAHRLLGRGGDAYGLWAILSSMLKNLVAVHAATDAGMNAQADIAEATGVHPFAVRSLVQYSRRLDAKKTASFVHWTADADRALKTGGLRATDEAPEEIEALVDAFILSSP